MRLIKPFGIALLAVVTMLSLAGCDCEPDQFGEDVTFVLPIEVGADRQFFGIEDTLWVTADFSNLVEVAGHQEKIELKGFNFKASLYISEISSGELRRYTTLEFFTERGEVSINQLGGYELHFLEADDRYAIRFGVKLLSPGIFDAEIYVDVNEVAGANSNHPGLYACEDNQRDRFRFEIRNPHSSRGQFDRYFDLRSRLLENFIPTFEGYLALGSFTFEVVE